MDKSTAVLLIAGALALSACAQSPANYKSNAVALQNRTPDCPGGFYPNAEAASGALGSAGMQCADPTMPLGAR